jgi:Flp pilus assembly protein TadG
MKTNQTSGAIMKRINDEQGAVTIIIAVTLGALLVVAALAIDAGMLYQERRQLQTAVDAAALAGAHELAEGRPGTVDSVARDYVTKNISTPGIAVTVAYPTATQVRVSATATRDLFFARSFGSKRASLSASATAGFGPAVSTTNLVPFIVPSSDVPTHIGGSNNFSFVLGEDRPTSGGGQGGFFWLCDYEPHGGGTPKLADWIVNGYPGEVSIGSVANGTGVKAALKSAMAERIAKDPNVVIPVYDTTAGAGANGEYHVVGFAEFVITGFKFTGNPKTISGYFTNGRLVVSAGSSASSSAADYGVRTVWLIN